MSDFASADELKRGDCPEQTTGGVVATAEKLSLLALARVALQRNRGGDGN
jgi:hypothetical protein